MPRSWKRPAVFGKITYQLLGKNCFLIEIGKGSEIKANPSCVEGCLKKCLQLPHRFCKMRYGMHLFNNLLRKNRGKVI
jgi:hypothetical protein